MNGKCEICKNDEIPCVIHHTSYLPQITMVVCFGCHNTIHKGVGLEKYKPSSRMAKIFYAKKGHLYFPNNNWHKYWTGKYWLSGHSRPLTDWEKILKKGMRITKNSNIF